jgi:Pyridoxamine 5'-phosphate oxidase
MSVESNRTGGKKLANREPVETRNLDRYGSPALPWSRPRDLLSAREPGPNATFFLSTSQPNGKLNSAGVGAVWHEGDLYFVSGPGTRKSRNLETNPACTISVRLEGIDLIFDGEARRVTDPSVLEELAAIYRASGWPAEVEGDAFTAPYMAPAGGPPPWYLFRFTFHTVIGTATAEPNGATRWRFGR